MCSITLMTIIVHVYILLLITILDIYDFVDVLGCFDAHCRCLLYHTCAFFALIEVMSGRLVNTCSTGKCCKCCIDTHLTFPALSCTSKALSEIFLQILKLGLYLLY